MTDLLACPKELVIDVRFTKYLSVCDQISIDREHIILIGFGCKWSTLSLMSCKNLEEFGANTELPVAVFNVDEEMDIDACAQLNILVGTSVMMAYYKNSPVIFCYDKLQDPKLMGSFNSMQLQTIAETILKVRDERAGKDVTKNLMVDMTSTNL